MIWILGLILAICAVVFLCFLGLALLRIAIELTVRLVLATGLAISAGCVAGLAAFQLGADGIVAGFIVTLLAFVPAFLSVSAWRGTVSERLARRDAVTFEVAKPVSAETIPIEQQLALEGAERLSSAWDNASRLAPNYTLSTSREACAHFLARFEAEADCEPENVDLAVFIRRQVPALVDETQAVLNNIGRQERGNAIAGMVASLKQLGKEAAAKSERHSLLAEERLHLRQSHFARRKAANRDWQ